MAQYMVTEPVSWSDEDEAKIAWALRVPIGEDNGNGMYDDCTEFEGFY